MNIYYDLHIHTVLSPCADTLMTPNNIFNMASIKGLDMIAITDHNSTKQLDICYEIAQSYDFIFIPGMEISLKEGFHVLVYFRTLEDAHACDHALDLYKQKITFDPQFYGEQELTDIEDFVIDHEPYLLSVDTHLSYRDLNQFLEPYDHILILAHLDRAKHSALPVLNQLTYDGIELTTHCPSNFISDHHLEHIKILRNSDAHQIVDIKERSEHNQLSLDTCSIDAFFRYFHHG